MDPGIVQAALSKTGGPRALERAVAAIDACGEDEARWAAVRLMDDALCKFKLDAVRYLLRGPAARFITHIALLPKNSLAWVHGVTHEHEQAFGEDALRVLADPESNPSAIVELRLTGEFPSALLRDAFRVLPALRSITAHARMPPDAFEYVSLERLAVTYACADWAAGALAAQPSLKVLSLVGCPDLDGAAMLAILNSAPETLEILRIAHNAGLDQSGYHAMVGALRRFTGLQMLEINQATDDPGELFAVIRAMPTLNALHLFTYTEAPIIDTAELLDALFALPRLEAVHLGNGSVHEPFYERVCGNLIATGTSGLPNLTTFSTGDSWGDALKFTPGKLPLGPAPPTWVARLVEAAMAIAPDEKVGDALFGRLPWLREDFVAKHHLRKVLDSAIRHGGVVCWEVASEVPRFLDGGVPAVQPLRIRCVSAPPVWPDLSPEDVSSGDSSDSSSFEDCAPTVELEVSAALMITVCPRAARRFGSYLWDWADLKIPYDAIRPLVQAARGEAMEVTAEAIPAVLAAAIWTGAWENGFIQAELEEIVRECTNAPPNRLTRQYLVGWNVMQEPREGSVESAQTMLMALNRHASMLPRSIVDKWTEHVITILCASFTPQSSWEVEHFTHRAFCRVLQRKRTLGPVDSCVIDRWIAASPADRECFRDTLCEMIE